MPERSPFIGLEKALLRSTQPSQPTKEEDHIQDQPPAEAAVTPPQKRSPSPRRTQTKNQAVTTAISTDSEPPSKLASSLASMLAISSPEAIEAIRKTVKIPGREVSFVRLTADEKAQLADIVYECRKLGRKTSENEINRIAVNYMLYDYKANGSASFLARVLAALLA